MICEKSSRFYEILPPLNYAATPIPPIDGTNITEKLIMIETLMIIETTTKILLGAHLMKMTLHPLTYSFNSLNLRIMHLPEMHPEY